MHLLDIIIVNYNSTDFLLKCLSSVYQATEGFGAEIFVQDNHSTDGVARVKTCFPNVRVNILSKNIGFSAAINRVLTECKGKYVVLLNPDSVVQKHCFHILIDYLEAHPRVGAVGPKILNSDGTIQGSARTFPTVLTALFGRSSFLTQCFPRNRITCQNILTIRCDGESPITADWLSGACLMLRREALLEIGYLDERFFLYWEDADLCKRLWDKNWKVVYFPRASVVHFVGGSSQKRLVCSVLEFHRSSFKLFTKYGKSLHRLFSPFVAFALGLRLVFMLGHRCLARGAVRVQRIERPEKQIISKRGSKKIHILTIISRLNIGGPSIIAYLLTTCLNGDTFESKLISGKISPGEGDMSVSNQ